MEASRAIDGVNRSMTGHGRRTARIANLTEHLNATVSAMQMTEDLIRNVVQEVLAQMGNGAVLGNGKAPSRPSGNLGVFATADDAVAAAEAAFRRSGPGRSTTAARPWTASARSASTRPRSSGGSSSRRRKIGRLDHKIAKLRDAIPRVPGVEYLRTDNDVGRRRPDADRLRPVRRHRRDHAGHPQPADPGRQRDQHAGRRATRSSSTPIPPGRGSRPRACAGSTRRSARRSGSRTC